MNQISLFVPFFFLILRISFCSVDPKFLACQPMTCGNNQNISYPFYIKGKQEASCGNPGFELSCNNNGFPILNLTSTNYIVQEIFYNNHKIRLTNEVFSESTTSDQCISQIQKFSVGKYNFYVAPDQTGALLFYGCDLTSLSESLKADRIGCSYENKTRSVVASYREDESLREACKGDVVNVAVEDGEGGIKEALRKGFVLNWNASNCDVCTRSGGRCGFDLNMYAFRCYCRDRPHAAGCDPDNESIGRTGLTIVGVAVAVVVSAFLICTFIIICCFRSKTSRWKINICMPRKGDQDVEAFFKNHGDLNMKRYKFSDVKKMTNAFKEKLGQGGFGVVYKGKLLNGCPVAVKILKSSKKEGADFINEVASISRTSHVNIVALLGFSFEGHKKALIYEFMANGSLEKFIYKNVGESETTPSPSPSLSWEILNDIAKGIARGLEYLHRGCNTRILHFDIKPHNILLDENFCPKISDFGLAKLCPRNESIISMSEARGTIGYVAPEVWNRHFGGVSHKSDVYSYGMMLLEMVGGRKNINAQASHSSEIYFPHWIYTKLEVNGAVTISTAEDDIAKKLTLVGLWCIQTFPNDRPTIRKVVEMLEGNVNSLEMPPKPVLSSPPRSEPESSTT